MHRLQAFDARLARIEGHLATFVLLSMILLASAQALLFNVAERGVAWAGAGVAAISFTDTFLQKGTLWLAFLGASLATHEDKHIAIDALVRTTSGATATSLRMIAALCSGLVACALSLVFYRASLASDASIPFEYEVLTAHGRAHICDVTAAELGSSARPGLLCAIRAGISALGVPIATGGGLLQLIAPLMLMVIGFRLLIRAFNLLGVLVGWWAPAVELPREKHG